MTEDERFAEIAASMHGAILDASDTAADNADVCELVRLLHLTLDGYVSRVDDEREHGGTLVARYMQSRHTGTLKPEFRPKHS